MNLASKALLSVMVALFFFLVPMGAMEEGGEAAESVTAPGEAPAGAGDGAVATREDDNTRVVLIEEFTASWCGPCVNMRTAVEKIMDDYGKTKVALLEYHVWNSGSGTLSTAQNDARADAYGVTGIPDVWVDGTQNIHGGGTVNDCYNRVKSKVDPRLALDSPLVITSDAEFTASTITVDFTIAASETVSQTNLKLNVAVYEMGAQGYDYVVRQFQTQDIANDGFPYDLQKQFSVGGSWNYQNMDGVIWVQVGTTGEIIQAANFGVDLAPNIPPVVAAGAPGSASFDEDTTYTDLDLTEIFTDEDEDDLTFDASGEDKLTVTGLATGSPTITPEDDWHGSETITFSADDGRGGTVDHDVAFTVNPVNDAPVVSKNLQDFQMDEDAEDTHLQLSKHFSDVDGDDLWYVAAGNENIEVSIDPATTVVTFTPEADWNGEEIVTFTTSDNALEASDDVKVMVVPQNDAPFLMTEFYPEDLTFDEDTRFTMDLYDHFDDIDGDSLWFFHAGKVSLDVTIDDYGFVTVVPDENFTGEETITFSATDTLETAEAEATFTVLPVNDAPVLDEMDDTYTWDEDVEEDISLGVVDAEDDDLDFEVTTDPPLLAELEVNDDLEIIYTPTNAEVGTYEVVVEVDDGNGGKDEMEFELEVRNLNDDPVAVIASPADGDIFVSGEEISFDGTASTDEDSIHGDSLRYRWQKDNKMLGEDDLFTDTIDKPGDYTIKLTVYDDAGRSSQTSVDITVEEDPTAIDDELPDGTDGAEPDATDGEEEDGSGEATTDKEGSTLMGMKTGYAVAVLAMVAVMIVVVLLGVILLTKKPPVPPPGTAPPPGAFPPQGPAQQGAMQTEYMGTGTQPDLYGSGTGTAPAPQPGMGSAPGSEAGAGLSGQTADNTLLLPPPNS